MQIACADRHGVLLPGGCLAFTGRPLRRFRRQDRSQPVEVGDDGSVHRHVEAKDPGLLRQQLADGDCLLAVLGRLGPVGADTITVQGVADRSQE